MSLQVRLQQGGGREPRDENAPEPTVSDPVELFWHLEASGRFHRDSGFGRVFHLGAVSLRENRPNDSLHIVVNENHISAHVDLVSPLGIRHERPSRYSMRRAVAHNLSGAAHDFVGVLRGRRGDHRCQLECDWLEHHSKTEPKPDDLLDPNASTWSVQLEARVAGVLDEGRLREALSNALGRRPIGRELLDVTDCPDDACLEKARADLQSTPVGVTSWPPLRARLARHRDGDLLMLNLNHAGSDGVGALHVLRAIAGAYAQAPEAPEMRPEFLAVSDLPVRPASAPISRVQEAGRRAAEYWRNRLAPPARLAAEEPSDEPGYGFHALRLSADDTRLLVRADRAGTSRNILLAALHLGIGEWNLRHGSPGRQVGVLVPVDLRPSSFPKEVVANFSVTARISTSRRHRAGPETAMKAVTSQTKTNKRRRTGVALLAGLERSGLLPLWARQSLVVLQPLTRNRLVDTAMLANLGEIERPPSFGAGAGEITEIWYSAPARTPESLCIGVVTLAGRMHLTFRYPHRLFGAGPARRFADCYVEQIRAVAADHWGASQIEG